MLVSVYHLVVKNVPEQLKQSFALSNLLRLRYISSLKLVSLSWEGINYSTKQPVFTQSAPRRWLNIQGGEKKWKTTKSVIKKLLIQGKLKMYL